MNKGYYIRSNGEKVEFRDDSSTLILSNQDIIKLDVSKCIKLKKLYCYDNQLKELDLSNNINLKELLCDNNQLNTLDLSNNINLQIIFCDIKTNINNINQFKHNKKILIEQV